MRIVLSVVGFAAILLYALYGGIIMSDLAVSAASGLPLHETIAAMHDANQPYSVLPGLLFAVAGSGLGGVWLVSAAVPARGMSPTLSVAAWATVLAFGAPAYFFASFGNLNSVGDTFVEWNAAAAAALPLPLYVTSVAAGVVAIICWVVGAVARTRVAGSRVPHRL